MPRATIPRIAQTSVLWTAFLASLPVYGGVGALARPTATVGDDRAVTFLAVFAVIALGNLLTIMPVYRIMVARAGSGPEQTAAARSAALVVAWARIEVVAVLGLVLYFLTGVRSWLWLFLAVAAAAMVVLAPRSSLLASDDSRVAIDPD